MTSESQERMLAIITPENWTAVRRCATKWEVRATRRGPRGRARGRRRRRASRAMLRIRDGFDGEVLAEVPARRAGRRGAALRPAPTSGPAISTRCDADDPTRRRAGRLAERRSARPVGRPRLGLSPVRLATLLEHRRRAGPRRRAAAPRRTGPTRRRAGALRSRPTRIRAGARSIRGSARRSPSPRASPTSPASAPPPRPSSTA